MRRFIRCAASAAVAGSLNIVALIPAMASSPEPPVVSVPVVASIESSTTGASLTPAQITLDHDFLSRHPAKEPTTVELSQDATTLDVTFDVVQREAIVASSETNGSSVANDDFVGVFLAPSGPNGFQYAFLANPLGAKYQTSSENSAYTPEWEATATRTSAGYKVNLRIPFASMRSASSALWRAQFVRSTVRSSSVSLWACSDKATSYTDATYFGTLQDIQKVSQSKEPRPQARADIYSLANVAGSSSGGNATRVGADLSLPITSTTSFVASLHPDVSNVETDQQVITPTAFSRQYTDVRPFFTQVAQPFNNLLLNLNAPTFLYTPAIPQFEDGYAVEGKQGPISFAAFDTLSSTRSDAAQTVNYTASSPSRVFDFNTQSIEINGQDGLHDDLKSISSGYANARSHEVAFLDYAAETGSTVSDVAQAKYFEGAIGYATSNTSAYLYYQSIGPQFAPADSYVAQNDLKGFNESVVQTIPFGSNTIFHDIAIFASASNLKDHLGRPAQFDESGQINFDFANLLSLHAFSTKTTVRTVSDEFLPFDGVGFYAGYDTATSTPSYIEYQGGPYYHGHLDAWTYLTTFKVMPRVHLSLETDENQYFSQFAGEKRTNQWLERASIDCQVNRELQIDGGVRRIAGAYLPVSYAAPTFLPVSASNVSIAVHIISRSSKSEFYAVYGDPNSLSTTPAIVVKFIRYLGAAKGT